MEEGGQFSVSQVELTGKAALMENQLDIKVGGSFPLSFPFLSAVMVCFWHLFIVVIAGVLETAYAEYDIIIIIYNNI